MGKTIAIAGKGGVGKTSVAALLIKYLRDKGAVPILGIDADPNSNLNESLGLKVEQALGQITEEMLEGKDSLSPGMSKPDLLTLKANQCIVESKGLDLLAMGRPEGPRCYCFANSILRDVINMISDQYPYLVIDNEAGMEHLSRRVMRTIDLMLIVTDPTVRGMEAVRKIRDLVNELGIRVSEMKLVVNRVRNGVPPRVKQLIDEIGIELAGTVAEDRVITDCDSEGKPLIEIDSGSRAARDVAEIARAIGL
jgi:CO dehydrogenase maturation factor